MLYVFHVDTGTMLTLDMTLAMDTVGKLQDVIGKTCQISPDKQVLLISGGESLDPTARVCSYAAGTDTNPIYLFSKSTIEAATPPSASVNYGAELDLGDQVEGCKQMGATYETVVARTQLALQLEEVAKEEMSSCEKLVHDQHLQHQGWAAVVANLEDITSAFQSRTRVFLQHMDDYLTNRELYIEKLAGLTEKLALLARIPLLPCLLAAGGADSGLASRGSMLTRRLSESVASFSTSPSTSPLQQLSHPPANLLEWISAQDSRNSLESMVQQCKLGIDQLGINVRENLASEVNMIIESIKNPSMKEVKGLEDRLFGLEQLMFGARKLVQEQSDMAAGFVQNQNRARNLKDMSVLPDLCASHRHQLEVMLKNQRSLVDIKKRCMAAKEELSVNLHTRLRWVMYVEKSICDVDSKLVVHHDTLKKLRRRLEISQQMYNAPEVYCSAVVEVVRRRAFSNHFLKWSHALVGDSTQVQASESVKRENVTTILKHHFLQALFPGFDDKPPGFATTSPTAFDDDLPSIQLEDIEYLREQVPELADKLKVPEEQDICRKLLVYTPVPSPAELNLPTPNLMQSVSSDIVVLCNNTQQPDELNLKGPDEDLVSDAATDRPSEPATKDFLLSVKCTDDVSSSVEVISHDEQPASFETEKLGDEYLSVAHSPSEAASMGEKKCLPTPGVSPDAEDAEGFTTADFYIDESLPSSMTESARSRKLVELQQQLTEKSSLLEQRERQLEDTLRQSTLLGEKAENQQKEVLAVSDKLLSAEEMLAKAKQGFHALDDLLEKGVLHMKCEVLSLSKQVHKDKDEFSVYVDSLSEKLVEQIAKFEETQTATMDETVRNLTDEYEQKIHAVKMELDITQQQANDSEAESSVYQAQLCDRNDQLDKLKEELETTVSALRQTHADELVVMRNAMVLEHELELDRARADLQEELGTLELQLTQVTHDLQQKNHQIQDIILEKEKLSEHIGAKFQAEKDEIIKQMQSDYDTRLKDEVVFLKNNHQKVIEDLTIRLNLEKEFIEKESEEQINSLKRTHQADMSKLQTDLDALRESDLAKQAGELEAKHEGELRAVFSQQKIELEAAIQAEPAIHLLEEDYIPLERHTEVINNAKLAMECEKQMELDELRRLHERELMALVERHDNEVSSLRSQHLQQYHSLEKSLEEKTDSLESMKSSMTAEKQVLFNKALDQAVADKKKVIEDLQAREKSLLQQQESDRALIAELQQAAKEPDSLREMETAARERETRTRMVQRRLEDDLAASKVQILELQSQFHSAQQTGAIMAQSVACVTPDASSPDRVQQLEMNLQKKEEEMNRLRHKVMELSMTTSSRTLVQDKVAITSCSIGDTVLLCLDERHDHYVVFTVGSVLHFLHSDCLEALALKPGPGDVRKSWVLAEITDKEYCQAKKPQNRFKVPIGTKFYRVKARPWSGGLGSDQAAMMVMSQQFPSAPRHPRSSSLATPKTVSLSEDDLPLMKEAPDADGNSLEEVKSDSHCPETQT